MKRILIGCFCFYLFIGSAQSQDLREFIQDIEELLSIPNMYEHIKCDTINCFTSINCNGEKLNGRPYFRSLKSRISCYNGSALNNGKEKYATIKDEKTEELNFLISYARDHPIFKKTIKEKYNSFKSFSESEERKKWEDSYGGIINKYEKSNLFILNSEKAVSFEEIEKYKTGKEKTVDSYLQLNWLNNEIGEKFIPIPNLCPSCQSNWIKNLEKSESNIYASELLKEYEVYNLFTKTKWQNKKEVEDLELKLNKIFGFNVNLLNPPSILIKIINSLYFLIGVPLLLLALLGLKFRKKIGSLFSSIRLKVARIFESKDKPDVIIKDPVGDVINWPQIINDLDKDINKSINELTSWLRKNENAVLAVLNKNDYVKRSFHDASIQKLKNDQKTIEDAKLETKIQAPPVSFPSNLTIKYADPPIGGYFKGLSDKPFMCPFKIEINGSVATYSTVNDNPDAQIAAIQGHMNTLQSCCIYSNQPAGSSNINTITPGTLTMEGDAWKVNTKAVIKFS